MWKLTVVFYICQDTNFRALSSEPTFPWKSRGGVVDNSMHYNFNSTCLTIKEKKLPVPIKTQGHLDRQRSFKLDLQQVLCAVVRPKCPLDHVKGVPTFST